jgi:hypothetical protein
MKKIVIIATFVLSLSGCLTWGHVGDRDRRDDRRDDQRQEQHDDHHDDSHSR